MLHRSDSVLGVTVKGTMESDDVAKGGRSEATVQRWTFNHGIVSVTMFICSSTSTSASIQGGERAAALRLADSCATEAFERCWER